MNTFIINLNDTIAISDSAMMELAKVISTCQPCFQEAETNCKDVAIVGIICLAIVVIALIAKWAACTWKDADFKANEAERKDKEEKEREESERKIKFDLLNKYLDFIKEQAKNKDLLHCKDNKTQEKLQKLIKSFVVDDKQEQNVDQTKCDQYRKVLEYLIELSQKGGLGSINKDTLDEIFNTLQE